MSTWVGPDEGFDELFGSFERQAWRWECRGVYRQPDEAEPWRRWRAGEPDDLAWLRPWLETVRAATRAGRQFARVRVFSEPSTEYQRWQLDLTPENVAAGEDMRMLTDSQARALHLPSHDFWLFDDMRVAVMHFEDDQFTRAEIVSEPREVDRYCTWKATAWHHAVPFASYVQ